MKATADPMRDVFVLGIGQTVFGKNPQYTAVSLGAEAASRAIDDAGIDPRDLQVAYGSRAYDANTTAQAVLRHVGVGSIEMVNVENACASGSTAVHALWKDIASGTYDLGITVGAESLTTSSRAGKLLGPPTGGEDLNAELGVSMPSHVALITRRMMETRGATMEDIVYPSVKNHRNACLNSFAQYRNELTPAEIINSRMICDPITLLQCCPFTDGAAAVVMCSADVAKRHTTKLVRMATSVLLSAPLEEPEDIVGYQMLQTLARTAYERASLAPEDVDLVELHDAFSPEEIWSYEDLLLCPKGEGIAAMRAGTFDIGGRVPVNPSGGLLSLGHPLGASGVRTVVEVTTHLRGEAGCRQTPNARVGLSQMVGGYVTGLWPPIAGGIQILTI